MNVLNLIDFLSESIRELCDVEIGFDWTELRGLTQK